MSVSTNPYDDGQRDCFMVYGLEAEKNQRYRALRNTVQFMLKITKETDTVDFCSVEMCNFNDYMNGFANGILELQQEADELDVVEKSLKALTGNFNFKTGKFVTRTTTKTDGLIPRLKQYVIGLFRKKNQDGND